MLFMYQSHTPLNVAPYVRHLHIAAHHEAARQIEAVLGVHTHQLVVMVKCVREHLVQPETIGNKVFVLQTAFMKCAQYPDTSAHKLQ